MHPMHILALGCMAVCAQSIFVREALAFLTGSEIVLGVVLAGWLFWIASGALIGGRLLEKKAIARFETFRIIAVAAAVLVPSTISAIRLLRGALAHPPGALAPFLPALLSCFLVTAPFGFIYGCLYNLATSLWKDSSVDINEAISRVYIWESAGAVFGASLFSFFLVSHFSQFESAVIVSLLMVFVVVLLPIRGGFSFSRIVLVAILAFVSSVAAVKVDRWSMQRIFPNYRLERFYSSRYGEIVVAGQQEVRSVFSAGSRLFSEPDPDRVEQRVHIPLLLHPSPRCVMFIGGSLGGAWKEALKHPSVSSLDCVELDGSLFSIEGVRKSSRDTTILRAPSLSQDTDFAKEVTVRFISADARFLLESQKKIYDVISVSTPEALTLQWNRFFTKEFFDLSARSLSPGGIFTIEHASSENYISSEAVRVLKSVKSTLGEVFASVSILPGSTALFVAGDRPVELKMLTSRLSRRRIEAPFVSEDYLPFRLSEERVAEICELLEMAREARINEDSKPTLVLYELAMEGKKEDSPFVGLFEAIAKAKPYAAFLTISTLITILFLFSKGSTRPHLAVASVGFGSLLLQIIVFLSYQSFSGLLYHAIVMLTALFMAGSSIGAYVSLKHGNWRRRHLLAIHGLFAVCAAIVAFSISALRSLAAPQALGIVVYLALSAIGGMLTGTYYPIVVRSAFREDSSSVPATFYAWDLLGACSAGLIGGTIVIPIIGFAGSAMLVAYSNIAAAVLLVSRIRR